MYLTTATTTTGTLMRSNAQQIQIQVQMQRQIQIQILETYLTTATTTNWNCYCKALERSTEGFIFSVQGNWFWVWVLRGMREQQKLWKKEFMNTIYDVFLNIYIKFLINVKLILTSFKLKVVRTVSMPAAYISHVVTQNIDCCRCDWKAWMDRCNDWVKFLKWHTGFVCFGI